MPCLTLDYAYVRMKDISGYEVADAGLSDSTILTLIYDTKPHYIMTDYNTSPMYPLISTILLLPDKNKSYSFKDFNIYPSINIVTQSYIISLSAALLLHGGNKSLVLCIPNHLRYLPVNTSALYGRECALR